MYVLKGFAESARAQSASWQKECHVDFHDQSGPRLVWCRSQNDPFSWCQCRSSKLVKNWLLFWDWCSFAVRDIPNKNRLQTFLVHLQVSDQWTQ